MNNEKIVLFYPHVPEAAREEARKILDTRWIGQGPKVDEFENVWFDQISHPNKAVAVGSGTDALHLAYILAGVGKGDEVITPVFTCTATNTPIFYQGAKPVFADIKPESLNIDVKSVEKLVNERTKAIVCVDYGGLPADLDELQAIADKWHIPLIEDACQAHGAMYKGRYVGSISDFTAFSFQAIKIITTCDGGMLTLKNSELEDKAKRIRWFGIDRQAKIADRWKNDIIEVGYKYQMTDISAAMGLEAMKILPQTLAHHRELFEAYREGLRGIPGITFIGDDDDHRSSCWLCTVLVERREDLKKKLAENGIESNQVHYRNDMYTVFGGRVSHCPNMDKIESKYLVLPIHYFLQVEDIKRICAVIKSGW
ncbi:MAG: DegT/DnrJ/EryC1/StrS family aminotransferase [Candidatus Falkowbacteria bacterium]|nr:DegT/DnrJ/EryC1/StrS family aminotransferase [Candidatus Falkowbacteria bacterium]